MPARFRGVGFFNAVLACPIDGTFFDAALVFLTTTLLGSADEAFLAGFVSRVVVGILIPSLVGG
ncbi:MAG: hypothetical protein WCF69_08425 [Mycobacterium sp.]